MSEQSIAWMSMLDTLNGVSPTFVPPSVERSGAITAVAADLTLGAILGAAALNATSRARFHKLGDQDDADTPQSIEHDAH